MSTNFGIESVLQGPTIATSITSQSFIKGTFQSSSGGTISEVNTQELSINSGQTINLDFSMAGISSGSVLITTRKNADFNTSLIYFSEGIPISRITLFQDQVSLDIQGNDVQITNNGSTGVFSISTVRI